MSRSRIAVLSLVAVLYATGLSGIGQASAEEGMTPPSHHYEHDRAERMKNKCLSRFARSAGHLAYLEARLQLTPAQQPLWDKWQQALAAGAGKQRESCLASLPAADAKPTALDRDTRIQNMLEIKVDSLKAARPALEALYQVLTPDQRKIFDHPRPKHGHGGFGHHPHSDAEPL
ncbi:MAG: hypothetical protein QOK29_2149 [Rhodospirillaceae bacterium]|jgi:hypothetical protein|nr:hypothetical protein [Rhodospirillaceae bacterium]